MEFDDNDLLEHFRSHPEHLEKLREQLTASTHDPSPSLPSPSSPMTYDSDVEATIEKPKRKSKKADDVERHIMGVLHDLYNERVEKDPSLKFDFNTPISSAYNKKVKANWHTLLLRKKIEQYKNEDWPSKKIDNRLTTYFWSKKTASARSVESADAKKIRDRRSNRLASKRLCRRIAYNTLLKNGKIPREKARDILLHINLPSDEETDEESAGQDKVLKKAQAPYRSEELLSYYDLIDKQRASAKRGGPTAAGQRLPRVPWRDRISSPPADAAAWTLRQDCDFT